MDKDMYKKICAILLAVLCAGTSASAYIGQAEVNINGERQAETIYVEQIDGTTLVPIRPIFEKFNFNIQWDQKRKRIESINKLGKCIIQVGAPVVALYKDLSNYEPYVLDTYVRITNNQTMIPMDFAAKCTGTTINFDEEANILDIYAAN